MPASDVLKTFRNAKDKPEEKSPGNKEGMDSGEDNSTSRIIKLTDDEQKTFQQAQPGEDLACEVHGSLESDGHFHVMSVTPMGGAPDYGSEKEMAGAVAQKVMPGMPPGMMA